MDKLTFLGTGTSTGVPNIGCPCDVCKSDDPRDKRLRSSAHLKIGGHSILIDTATDLRQQALRAEIESLDAVFYTHHHADHIHGIDELRSYNFIQKRSIPCYGPQESLERIRHMFSYIFDGAPIEGGGKPSLELIPINGPISLGGEQIIPITVMHGSLPIFGYRVRKIAYITDCSLIPEDTKPALRGLDTLIVGALGLPRHSTHFTLERALEAIEEIEPKKAFITHINHNLGHVQTEERLPKNVFMAYDGMKLKI